MSINDRRCLIEYCYRQRRNAGTCVLPISNQLAILEKIFRRLPLSRIAILLVSLFFLSNLQMTAKNRVIEEVRYKGARKDSKYWLDEAQLMMSSVQFIKEKANIDAGKKTGADCCC